MEDTFEQLKQKGKNDVESLIKWLKDSQVMGEAKTMEEKARLELNKAGDKTNVELAKFKETITKLAEEQKKNVDELTKKLAEEGPKLMDALAAGVSAFKEAMTKK